MILRSHSIFTCVQLILLMAISSSASVHKPTVGLLDTLKSKTKVNLDTTDDLTTNGKSESLCSMKLLQKK